MYYIMIVNLLEQSCSSMIERLTNDDFRFACNGTFQKLEYLEERTRIFSRHILHKQKRSVKVCCINLCLLNNLCLNKTINQQVRYC